MEAVIFWRKRVALLRGRVATARVRSRSRQYAGYWYRDLLLDLEGDLALTRRALQKVVAMQKALSLGLLTEEDAYWGQEMDQQSRRLAETTEWAYHSRCKDPEFTRLPRGKKEVPHVIPV